MTPVKPRPRVVPRASTNMPGWKISSSFSVCPTSHLPANSALAPELLDDALRRHVRLLEEAGERLGRVLLLALLEAEDEGDVAVLLEGALADDDDGTRLDDGDAGDGAVLLEELGRSRACGRRCRAADSWGAPVRLRVGMTGVGGRPLVRAVHKRKGRVGRAMTRRATAP